MSIWFTVESDAAEKIRQLAGAQLESSRSNLVREALIGTLQETITRNPVDTARSRAAWVAALEELGGTPPSGWEGPHPTGVEEGRQNGQMRMEDSESATQASATNSVNYINALEYGTSRMSPFAMIRGALQATVRRLPEWFRL